MIAASLHPEPVRAACQRRSRWGFALTGRSIGLLIVGFFLAHSGLLGRYAELRDAGLGRAGAAGRVARRCCACRMPAELTAGRSWTNAPALDSETEIELAIENNEPRDSRLPPRRRPALCACRRSRAYTELTAFPRVPASVRYRIEPQERGDCEAGWLYVRYRSPLGLAERWAKAPLTQTVRVYPALRTGEEQQIFLARSRQIDLQLRLARQRGLGRDFESLREYREGDDLRDICWTATARRGSPITRQYQTERSQPVWIVLDCGRLMRSRVALAGKQSALPAAEPGARVHSKLDYACTTAVSLAQLALYSGDRVGLLAYGQCSSAAPFAGARLGTSATVDRIAGAGAGRRQRSRPPAGDGDAQPAAAASRR